MANTQAIIDKFQETANNPRMMLDEYLKQGKKVIGCFPVYTPSELIHAAGMVPMGMWGGQVNPAVAGQYAPIFICSIMRSCLEFGMVGKYKGLSAVLMPILCDTYRGMSGAWRVGVKDIPLVAFIQPQNRDVTGAKEFLVSEYEEVRKALEGIAGHAISDADIEKSIKVYNENNAAIRKFSVLSNKHLDVITPKVRHAVIKSAHFMLRDEHTALLNNLMAELEKLPEHKWEGKKVALTGITAEPSELLEIFAENNIAVIGDDLAQETRQFRTDIPEGGSPMERLAQQWFDRRACSTVHETVNSRGKLLVDMVKAEKADGVVICLMSFCDVEEYEFPMLVKEFKDAGIPNLRLEIDQSTQDSGQSRTKIQTFIEMI